MEDTWERCVGNIRMWEEGPRVDRGSFPLGKTTAPTILHLQLSPSILVALPSLCPFQPAVKTPTCCQRWKYFTILLVSLKPTCSLINSLLNYPPLSVPAASSWNLDWYPPHIKRGVSPCGAMQKTTKANGEHMRNNAEGSKDYLPTLLHLHIQVKECTQLKGRLAINQGYWKSFWDFVPRSWVPGLTDLWMKWSRRALFMLLRVQLKGSYEIIILLVNPLVFQQKSTSGYLLLS